MNKSCKKAEEDEGNNISSSRPAATWSELPLDLLGEIKKKLYWGDHVRFSGVCKTWLEAQHAKRAGDGLPWLLLIDHDNLFRVSYYIYEPFVSYDLYISQVFDASLLPVTYHISYHHGCLLISTDDRECSYSYFLLFSLATRKVTKLPRLNWLVARRSLKFFTAVSTNPTALDCVFLALHITNDDNWHISTFQHGDTRWTTQVSTQRRYEVPNVSCVEDVVFIHGVFYFLFSGGRLGSYEVATMKLNVDHYSNTNNLRDICKFIKLFVLDEELVVIYFDESSARKMCIRRFDWSQKDWVPLESLGDRSMFVSQHSFFVDAVNCYGGSPNKIFIYRDGSCYVYSLKNAKLSTIYASSPLRNWHGTNNFPESSKRELSMWVEPPDLLLPK